MKLENETSEIELENEPSDVATVGPIRRIVYLSLAAIFFVLGMLGIALPGLPTTPFLLLTSYFLARSSPRLHRMLLSNRLVGPILRNWQENRAIELHTKITALTMVVLAIIFVIGFSQLSPFWLTIVLVLACVGSYVIWSIPTLKDETP